MTGRWHDISPRMLWGMLFHVDATWALAGGYALEASAGGARRRAHSDIEIACFRDELPALLDQLAGFEIFVARNKQVTPYLRSAEPPPPWSLWVRRPRQELWDFEILVEERDGTDWLYRRAPEIRLPVEKVFLRQSPTEAMLYVAPEVQLLYKAKAPRPKDFEDFRAFWPGLNEQRQDWLRAAIATAHPDFLPHLDEIEAEVR